MRLFRRLRTESRPGPVPSGISSSSLNISNHSFDQSARPSCDFSRLRSSSVQSFRPSFAPDGDEDLDLGEDEEDTVEFVNTPKPSSSSTSISSSLREQMQPTLRRHGTLADISALMHDQPPPPPPSQASEALRRDETGLASPRNAINLDRGELRRNGLTLERSQTDLREKVDGRQATPSPPTAAVATTGPFVPRQRSNGRFSSRSRPSTADGPAPRSTTSTLAATTPTASSFAVISPSKLRFAGSASTKLGQPQTPAEKCRSESEERDTANIITHILPPPFGFDVDAFEERVDLIIDLVSCYALAGTSSGTGTMTAAYKHRRLDPTAVTRQIVERVELRTERMLVELLAIDRVDKALVTQVRLPLVFALVRQQCGLDPAQSLFRSFEPEADATTLASLAAVVYPGFGLIRTISEVIEPRHEVASGLVFFGNEAEPIMPSLAPPPRAKAPKKRRPTTAPTTPARPEFGATVSAPSLTPIKRMSMAVPPPRRSSKRFTTVAPISVPSPHDPLETTSREELPWTPVSAVRPLSMRHPYATAANDAITSAYPDTPTTPTMPLSRRPAVPLLAPSPTRQGSSSRGGSASPEAPSLQMEEGSEGGWDSSARPSFSTTNSASASTSTSGSPVARAVATFGPAFSKEGQTGVPRPVTHGSLL